AGDDRQRARPAADRRLEGDLGRVASRVPLQPEALLGREAEALESRDQARPEQSGRHRLDRHQPGALRAARIARTVPDRSHRVARLHPDDELGRGPCGLLREGWHPRAVSMTRDRRNSGGRIRAVVVAVLTAAGAVCGWSLHGGLLMPVVPTTSAAGPATPRGVVDAPLAGAEAPP